MTTTTPPVIYPPGSTPPHAEASLGSKEFNPKIPIESEECNSMPPNGKSCWFPVGYRGESRSVHQHLGHGPLSCRQRRLQACFRRCMRARGLSCGMQSRCDVVITQGLGGWRAMAASKVVLQCCLYSRSVHQHLGHGPLSCRQRRLQACFGDACVLEASHVACDHDAMSSQRKV